MKENTPPTADAWRWRKSSYSHPNGDCVELGWRKSSYSQPNGGQCVELTPTLDAVRDSKNPTDSRLNVDLNGLLDAVKAGRLNR